METDRIARPNEAPVNGEGRYAEARRRLARFLRTGLDGYAEARNDPSDPQCSNLSPYLHFGQISPVEIVRKAQAARHGSGEDRAAFLEELVVRRDLCVDDHRPLAFLDYEACIQYSQTQKQLVVTGINAVCIYSPIKQVADQDSKGEFIRCHRPELARVPNAFIAEPHAPCPQTLSERAGASSVGIIGRPSPNIAAPTRNPGLGCTR